MRPNDDRSKLEKIDDSFSLVEDFQEGFKSTFDAIDGYTIPNEDAPDLGNYEDWERYAIDAHEWASEELERRHERALEAVQAIPADEQPPLGHQRPDDREQREAIDDAIFEAYQALRALAEVREWLGRLEEEY